MYTLDYAKYAQTARQLCADSCVLLKNDATLPISSDKVLSVFGRIQIDTFYCGTGSGGMVNLPYLVNLVDGLNSKFTLNEELLELYKSFIEENPFDKGQGWAQEPFFQKDLPLTDEIVKNARAKSDVAIYIIGRSAGEDKDCLAEKGSYYLTDIELENMRKICKFFDKTLVILNVGGILDMSFVEDINPSAVMYAWHGGAESGNGYADVICGDVNPSGSLPNTISKTLDDNITTKNFGNLTGNLYEEDIYVGYRYFETFAKEKVLYPFGFGLSYTDFIIESSNISVENDAYICEITVKNTGSLSGKKSVQIYAKAPQGKLGKAEKVLVGFAKTNEIAPNCSETVKITVNPYDFSSYDEENSEFILENGDYEFLAGFDVRNTCSIIKFTIDKNVSILKCNEALAPTKPFNILKPGEKGEEMYVPVRNRSYAISDRISSERGEIVTQKDSNFTFDDVISGKTSAKEYLNQLSDLDLIHISRGEGMCSPKVTSGTAGCIGGVTERLKSTKLPIICCADGPSGIRMDSGTMAFSIPNGTAIASTFDTNLVANLFDFLGIELVKNNIDTILGPGINIHRNPLCGRNFEYFSEDPFLTGKMAVAELSSLHKYNVTGTIKHFVANNQEAKRREADSIISERALREIYLKAFEMAVKDGGAFSIMTAYNPVNGVQAASNFDLNTTILRKEWGFDGLVMTDWWATMNFEGEKSSEENVSAMILSQNDVYMVNADALSNSRGDNAEEMLEKGEFTRYELLRNAENVVKAMLKLICSKGAPSVEVLNEPENKFSNVLNIGEFVVEGDTVIDCTNIDTTKGTHNKFTLTFSEKGKYNLTFDVKSIAPEIAQLPLTVASNGVNLQTITLKGTSSVKEDVLLDVSVNINSYIDLFFGESGMIFNSLTVKKI